MLKFMKKFKKKMLCRIQEVINSGISIGVPGGISKETSEKNFQIIPRMIFFLSSLMRNF